MKCRKLNAEWITEWRESLAREESTEDIAITEAYAAVKTKVKKM